jgi:hypothetical protein
MRTAGSSRAAVPLSSESESRRCSARRSSTAEGRAEIHPAVPTEAPSEWRGLFLLVPPSGGIQRLREAKTGTRQRRGPEP